MANSILEKQVLGYSEFTSKKGVLYCVLHCAGKDTRVQGLAVEQIMVARDLLDVQTEDAQLYGKNVYAKPVYNRSGYCVECTLYNRS